MTYGHVVLRATCRLAGVVAGMGRKQMGSFGKHGHRGQKSKVSLWEGCSKVRHDVWPRVWHIRANRGCALMAKEWSGISGAQEMQQGYLVVATKQYQLVLHLARSLNK